MKRVGIIHTSFVSVDYLQSLFREIMPEVGIVNIVDDSMLSEVVENGHVTQALIQRYCGYATNLERMGVQLILNQCSSVGEVVDVARTMIRVPIVKIDEPMAEKAVRSGRRISVLATVASTVGPSVRLLQTVASRLGKSVFVTEHLVEGALEILMRDGDRQKHDHLVLEMIQKVQDESDVIVLAQGSMVVLIPLLSGTRVPILTSPRLGVERVKDELSKIGN